MAKKPKSKQPEHENPEPAKESEAEQPKPEAKAKATEPAKKSDRLVTVWVRPGTRAAGPEGCWTGGPNGCEREMPEHIADGLIKGGYADKKAPKGN